MFIRKQETRNQDCCTFKYSQMIAKEICAKEKYNFFCNYDRNSKITLKGCYKVVK